MANKESGFRPRFNQAAIFQLQVSLNRCRYADAMLPAGAAHRGDSIACAQDAAFDQLANVRGDPGIKRISPPRGVSGKKHCPLYHTESARSKLYRFKISGSESVLAWVMGDECSYAGHGSLRNSLQGGDAFACFLDPIPRG